MSPQRARRIGRMGRTVRATRAAFAIVVLAVGLLILSSSTQDGWLVLLAGLGFGLVATAVVLTPRIERLDVEVVLPERARTGEPLIARVTVTNQRRGTSVPLTLRVESDRLTTDGGPGAGSARIPALGHGQSAVAELPLVAARRGAIGEVDVTTRTTAPFSLVAVTHRRTVPVDVLIHPAPADALVLAPTGSGNGTVPAAAPRGLEVHGIREWRRGEPVGRLHARGTARHGRPLVLERHDDVGEGLAVVIAGADAADAAGAALHELMVAVVAATLAEHAAGGRPVTAYAARRDAVTTADRTALLDWCARLDGAGRATPSDLARAATTAGRGGAVVLAALDASEDLRAVEEYTAAVRAQGAELYVLHRATDQPEALCLHATDRVGAGARS